MSLFHIGEKSDSAQQIATWEHAMQEESIDTPDGHSSDDQKIIYLAWIHAPHELLEIALESIIARALKYRSDTVTRVEPADAEILHSVGYRLDEMTLWKRLPKMMSERGTPGMTQKEFNDQVFEPASEALVRWQQFQRERTMVACSRTVQILEVLVPLIKEALVSDTETAFMALAVLYAFDIVPARWLPSCTYFRNSVSLYSHMRGLTIANIPALCRDLRVKLELWIRSNN
ncbi:MAG: hypothetical protein EBU84_05240 [Actinobacteria bacterium]|nr:hypothetical protein [Actinomycetota bacterium]